MYYITPLGLGRYYSFRIAAVNENGSLGFSKPTDGFRLSTGMCFNILQFQKKIFWKILIWEWEIVREVIIKNQNEEILTQEDIGIDNHSLWNKLRI